MRFGSFISLLLLLTAGTLLAQTGTAHLPTGAAPFVGRVVYSVAAEGTDTAQLELFRAFSASSYTLVYGTNGRIRMTESGGATGLDILIDLKRKRYFQLRGFERTAYVLKRTDYEGKFPPLLLDPQNERDTIDGYPCLKYKVLNSIFVRRGATAYIWVQDSITLPMERGEYTGHEGFRAFFPLPCVLGVQSGTVMRLVVQEGGVVVTYTASVTPGPIPEETFAVPSGYTVRNEMTGKEKPAKGKPAKGKPRK